MESTLNSTGYVPCLSCNYSQDFTRISYFTFITSHDQLIEYWLIDRPSTRFSDFIKLPRIVVQLLVCSTPIDKFINCALSQFMWRINQIITARDRLVLVRHFASDKLFASIKFTLNDFFCPKHAAICAPFLISGRQRRSTLHPLLQRWPNRVFHYWKILNWISWVLCIACAGHKCSQCPVWSLLE